MRLIDADALLEKVQCRLHFDDVISKTIDKCVEITRRLINDAPTIEAEPVRHGRWEECDWVEYDGHSECVRYPKKGRVCTNCRNAFKKEFIDSPRVHCCPNCGAKMDGGGGE